MGGNAKGYIKSTGEFTQAQKIPIKIIGRQVFIKKILSLLNKINDSFLEKYKVSIWNDSQILKNGIAFNGSSSYIMNPSFSDYDIERFKPSAGDLDVAVPENLKKNLIDFFEYYEGKEIISGIRYMGRNQNLTIDQINCVFLIDFDNNLKVACQIDFEFLPFENNKPNEWGKFSHSSSFEDQKEGIKAVFHKYVIRSLVSVLGIRNDIVIATNSSTPNNIKLSTNKVHEIPRMYKFSVSMGIRKAYSPLIDTETGKCVEVDGKKVFKEIPTKISTFETSVYNIMKLCFGREEIDNSDMSLFWSFIGICHLIKKYLEPNLINLVSKRFEELIWGTSPDFAQEIEMNDPQLDYDIKYSSYKKFISILGLDDNSKKLATEYYKKWKRGGNPTTVQIK